MSVMIQIRNVPEEVHHVLKSRAALAGMSLSDFLLKQLQEVVARPTLEELRARLNLRSSENPFPSAAEAIREERERP